jgi:hypothetical protein
VPELSKLSDDDRRTLWQQFVEVYARSQRAYDESVRTLAAAGVAVTVSIGTAIKGLHTSGLVAVVLFLGALAATFTSYASVQLDMKTRLAGLRRGDSESVEGNSWTKATTTLNALAGVGLMLGGVFLAVLVANHA